MYYEEKIIHGVTMWRVDGSNWCFFKSRLPTVVGNIILGGNK